MDEKEFQKYFESLTTAKESFYDKAREYQNKKNKDRPFTKRWNENIIERRVDRMWKSLIDNMYFKVGNSVKDRNNSAGWKNIMSEDMIENIDQSIFEIDFDEA